MKTILHSKSLTQTLSRVKSLSFFNGNALVLFLMFLFTGLDVKANDFYCTSNYPMLQEATEEDEFSSFTEKESVVLKSESSLSQKDKQVKPLMLSKKYDDKSGGLLRKGSSSLFFINNHYDEVVLNYNFVVVSKVKLFLFYSSQKIPFSL